MWFARISAIRPLRTVAKTRDCKMTRTESDALMVLAPGVFIRAGVHCPDCRHQMTSQHEKRGSLIHWTYVCKCCGTVLNTNFKRVSFLNIWRQLETAQ